MRRGQREALPRTEVQGRRGPERCGGYLCGAALVLTPECLFESCDGGVECVTRGDVAG